MRALQIASLGFDRLKDRSEQIIRNVDGATAIEYALIATLISVAIVGSVTYFGSQLNNAWLYLATTVNPELAH